MDMPLRRRADMRIRRCVGMSLGDIPLQGFVVCVNFVYYDIIYLAVGLFSHPMPSRMGVLVFLVSLLPILSPLDIWYRAIGSTTFLSYFMFLDMRGLAH